MVVATVYRDERGAGSWAVALKRGSSVEIHRFPATPDGERSARAFAAEFSV